MNESNGGDDLSYFKRNGRSVNELKLLEVCPERILQQVKFKICSRGHVSYLSILCLWLLNILGCSAYRVFKRTASIEFTR